MFATKEWVKNLLGKVLKKILDSNEPTATRVIENVNVVSDYATHEIYSKTFEKDEILNATYVIAFPTNDKGSRTFRLMINDATIYQVQVGAASGYYTVASIPILCFLKANSKLTIEVGQNSGTTLQCSIEEIKMN